MPEVLDGKFSHPKAATGWILRPRLLRGFDETEWRVAAITAGAGTGKTVLATQWLECSGGQHAWLTLDSADNRAERFWCYVAAALQRAQPGAFGMTENLANGQCADVEEITSALLTEAWRLEHPMVLVLEDLHTVSEPAILTSLASIVEFLPPAMRLLCTSRSDLQLPTSRWRARSWLLELRQRDLAFDHDESCALLTTLGESRLEPDEIERLRLHAEGWASALVLAAIAMKGQNASDVAAHISGANRMIADLLTTEVIDRQSAEVRELMLCSSIVEDFDAELCNVLTGGTSGQAQLRMLEAETHFLNVIDEIRPTYRYHQLLREALHLILEEECPGRAIALNRLAAEVFEARGEFSRAVGHWLDCGDRDRAFELAFGPAFERWDHGTIEATARWLDAFSVDYISGDIARMLRYAFALGTCWRWDAAGAWLDRAEHALANDEHPRAKDVATLDAFRMFYFATDGTGEDGIERGRRVLAQIDRGLDLGLIGARVRPVLTRALLLVGDTEGAKEVARGPRSGDQIGSMVIPRGVGARIALREGRLNEATELAERAFEAAAAAGTPNHFVTLDAHIAHVGVLTDRNELADTSRVFEQMREITARYPSFPYRVITQLAEAGVVAARGDLGAALFMLNALRDLVNERHRPWLERMVDAAEARYRIETDDTARAESLIARLNDAPVRTLLEARLHLVNGRPDCAVRALDHLTFVSCRDQVGAQLLYARAAIVQGNDPSGHLDRIVALATPERLVRMVIDEGEDVARLVRRAADVSGVVGSARFAAALGSPPKSRREVQGRELLSERELAVLRYLPTRLTNKEIAAECAMSVNTVKVHLKHIYTKLSASSRTEAVSKARLLGSL